MWHWIKISHVQETVLSMEKQNPLRIIIPMVLTIILASKHLHTPLALSRNRAAPGSDLISVYSHCSKRWYALQLLYFPERTNSYCPGEILGLAEYSEISAGKCSDWGLGVNGHLERGSSRSSSQCLTQELSANSFLPLQCGDKKSGCWLHLTLISSSGWVQNVPPCWCGLLMEKSLISAFNIVCCKQLISKTFPFEFSNHVSWGIGKFGLFVGIQSKKTFHMMLTHESSNGS